MSGPSKQTSSAVFVAVRAFRGMQTVGTCSKLFLGKNSGCRTNLGVPRLNVRCIVRLASRVANSPARVSKSIHDVYGLKTNSSNGAKGRILFHGVHHVALLCEDLERSLGFYCDVLGLEINPDRPHDKLPYRGAWLWIGPEMIHLMELPNPDPLEGRPVHGGRDRHFCVGVESIDPLESRLKEANVEFTRSMSGRPAIFFRDPDMNCLECVQLEKWR